LDLIVETIS